MPKPSRNRSLNESLKVFGPAIIIMILGFFIAYQFVDPAPQHRITIATGSPEGAYYAFGKAYSSILQKYGITLEVITTAGSAENLQLLNKKSGGGDVAFFQGGVPAPGNPDNITSLGSLYFEPMWVFFSKGLAINRLSDLRGRRIAVGFAGSGTRILALQLLNLNDISAQNTKIFSLGGEKAADKLMQGELEAAFFVTAHHSPVIQQLLRSSNIQLMSFKRAEAYTMRFHYLSRVKLPQGAIDFAEDIPSGNIQLLAPTTRN